MSSRHMRFSNKFRSLILDYSTLRVVDASEFSSDKPHHMHQLINVIQQFCPNFKSCVDATAHIGGFSLFIAKIFDKAIITAFEPDKTTFEALEYNIQVTKSNITAINSSCLTDFPKTDFIYYDPPWGGKDYKNGSNMELYLDDI